MHNRRKLAFKSGRLRPLRSILSAEDGGQGEIMTTMVRYGPDVTCWRTFPLFGRARYRAPALGTVVVYSRPDLRLVNEFTGRTMCILKLITHKSTSTFVSGITRTRN